MKRTATKSLTKFAQRQITKNLRSPNFLLPWDKISGFLVTEEEALIIKKRHTLMIRLPSCLSDKAFKWWPWSASPNGYFRQPLSKFKIIFTGNLGLGGVQVGV